ncbi:2TM domain-containing protein [Hyunsoonleella jejuensis]
MFILLHGWNVYKGRLFFKEKWEERKTQEFMKEQNETIMWE